MKNLTTFINETKRSYIDEVREQIENNLKNEFTLSISGGFKLNNKFFNRVGGYAIEAMLNNVLTKNDENCNLDAKYMTYDIEIKAIKDKKCSEFNRMFTEKERAALGSASTLVIFVDYSQSGDKFIIEQITLCDGTEVEKDGNARKTIQRMSDDRIIKL